VIDLFTKFSQWADDCPENRSVSNLNGLIKEITEQSVKALKKYDRNFFYNHDCCMTANPSKEAEEALAEIEAQK